VNRFNVIPLVAIRLRCDTAILNRNHYQKLREQEKVVLQATFIVNNTCQLCYDIWPIIYHLGVFIMANNSIYIERFEYSI